MVGNVKIRSLGAPYYNAGAPALNGWFTDAITGVTSAVSTWFSGKSKEDTSKIYADALAKQYEQQKQLTDLFKLTLVGVGVVLALKAVK